MKKRLVRFLSAVLSAGLLLSGLSAEAVTVPESQNIRIGLYYGSDALAGANLLNSTGTGYRLGYYDDDRNFQTLATTAETGISVVKTQNVYYSSMLSDGFGGYTDTTVTDIAVGCYHIQLPGSYATYDEAAGGAAPTGGAGGFPARVPGT